MKLHSDRSGASMQLRQNHSKVGSAQIEGQKGSLLAARRQPGHVRHVALDICGRVSRSANQQD